MIKTKISDVISDDYEVGKEIVISENNGNPIYRQIFVITKSMTKTTYTVSNNISDSGVCKVCDIYGTLERTTTTTEIFKMSIPYYVSSAEFVKLYVNNNKLVLYTVKEYDKGGFIVIEYTKS